MPCRTARQRLVCSLALNAVVPSGVRAGARPLCEVGSGRERKMNEKKNELERYRPWSSASLGGQLALACAVLLASCSGGDGAGSPEAVGRAGEALDAVATPRAI